MKIYLLPNTSNLNSLKNEKDIKNKNNGNKENNFSFIPISSINTNKLGTLKTLINNNRLSFGVKRLNILAPNLNFDELITLKMKKNQELPKNALEKIKNQFIRRNNVINDYCLKFISGKKLEDLNNFQKCENYINSNMSNNEFPQDNSVEVLEKAQNQFYQQIDSLYEVIKDNLPQKEVDIRKEISNLKKQKQNIESIMQNRFYASRDTLTYKPNRPSIRYTILGELIKQEKEGIISGNFSDARCNLFKICSYTIFSSMRDTDFITLIKNGINKKNLPDTPQPILNILKNSEMVFSNFNMEENLELHYDCNIKDELVNVYSDLKIRLLKTHLKNINENELKKYGTPDELLKELIQEEENSKNIDKKTINKKQRKKKKKSINLKKDKSNEIQKTQDLQIINNTKLTINNSNNVTLKNKELENDSKLNEEFKLVGLSFDNTLEELGNKNLFYETLTFDNEHNRYMASIQLTNKIFQGLYESDKLDQNIKNYIKIEKISDREQHFVGAFLSRLKDRNPKYSLKNCINILEETLNDGIMLQSLTKDYNSKFDIYSLKHKIMIPFDFDTKENRIHLRTLLDFQDEENRKKRHVKDPFNNRCFSYTNLYSIDSDLNFKSFKNFISQNPTVIKMFFNK